MGQTHSASSVENVLDSRPESIRKQVDESLHNLQTDYIDLYYQHRIDPNVPAEAVAEVMGELIKAGKIHHWGVSNTPIEYMVAAHAVTPITAMENQYSMVFRAPEKALFAFCEANHIGFVAYSPLGNGFLSGRFNAQTQYAESDFRRTMGRFRRRGDGEQSTGIGFISRNRRRQIRHRRANRVGVGTGAKALYRTDSGHHQKTPLGGGGKPRRTANPPDCGRIARH